MNDVASALVETSMFKNWCLSSDDVMSIAAMTVDSLLTVGFAVEHKPLDGNWNSSAGPFCPIHISFCLLDIPFYPFLSH